MSKAPKDIPGNAVGSHQQYQLYLVRMAEQLLRAERTFDRLYDEVIQVERVTIRVPQNEGDEYFVIVKAHHETGEKVAFHSAESFGEAVKGVLARLENGSLKWKDDQYAS